MEKINNFKKKGGIIVWTEKNGVQASYREEPKKFLIEIETNSIFRITDKEYSNPPPGFIRAKGFYG